MLDLVLARAGVYLQLGRIQSVLESLHGPPPFSFELLIVPPTRRDLRNVVRNEARVREPDARAAGFFVELDRALVSFDGVH